ncbi:unnamed protein product [Darwinula stevensoni]|uniref:Uncharacterized protein n=1 Tax=Darwinula stevensoni TaxID=69355 RepID=A0A7R8XD60_9CRUS|nr:unnamed protein product [Darwinula stevensoni]CAG0889504.1 unnamed protein product [Darwinula stevensoni]
MRKSKRRMADSDEKRADRLKKLRELHRRRNEARQLNHQEVIEEDKRNKLPTNWEAKKRRAEWELDEDRKKQEAVEKFLFLLIIVLLIISLLVVFLLTHILQLPFKVS